MMLLAQISALEPKPPTPLPDPPWLASHFLESPLLVIAILAAAAFIAYAALNSANKPKLAKRAIGLCAVLAVLVGFIATLVKTPREQALAITRQLAADVAAGNARGVDSTLAPSAALYSDQFPQGQPRDVILTRVSSLFGPTGQFPIENHAILESQAFAPSANLAQVQVKVRVVPKGMGLPVLSWWRLDFTPTSSGGWQASGIRLLSSNVPFAAGGV